MTHVRQVDAFLHGRSSGGFATWTDVPPAPSARRFAAWALDVAIGLVLGGWVLLRAWTDWLFALRPADATVEPAPGGVGIVLATLLVGFVALVQWVTHGRLGWTVGRRVLGIRTLDVETRIPIGMTRVLLRQLVVAAGLVVCGLGQFLVVASPLFDRTGRGRGWHDLAVKDEVLDVRPRVHDAHVGTVPDVPALVHMHSAVQDAVVQDAVEPVQPGDDADPILVPAMPGWVAGAPAGSGAPATATAQLDAWLGGSSTLVLAPISPQRRGPDLDTRAIPIVRAAAAAATTGLPPELEMTRPAPPRTDVVADPGSRTRAPRTAAVFEFGDGRRLKIERTALVGRNPASDADVQLVRVVDPARSVSKTHLQVGVDSGRVWIADRGSTNGTVVTLPDGDELVCEVDQQVRVPEGSVIQFGDCELRLVRLPDPPEVT